jgi:hypothetical protein
VISRSVIFCPKDVAAQLSENTGVHLARAATLKDDLDYLKKGSSIIITEDISAEGYVLPPGMQIVFIEGFPTDGDLRKQIESRFNRIVPAHASAAVTKDQLLDEMGDFTWLFGQEFFIETDIGNFLWKDPDYDGDNTIRPYEGGFKDYLVESKMEYGRGKGRKLIRTYCGEDFILISAPALSTPTSD